MSDDLVGALVAFINPANNEVVAAGVVQLDGSLNVKVPKGTYRLVVAKSGYMVYETTINVTEDTSVNVTLSQITVPILESPSATKYTAGVSESVPSTALSESPSATLS